MQRARRRITCSAACIPSPSTTLQTRKRSRTSSAGGDCAEVSKKPRTIPNVSDPRGKSRTTKNAGRCAFRNARTSKFAKGKSSKPVSDRLQNTIVLAPFHTLKKVFQSKLLDLYSHDKVKKISHKIKSTRKQNTTFAYDVVELKGLNKSEVKKGAKARKKVVKKDTHQRHDKSGSSSYCQCPRKSNKSQNKAGDAKAQKHKSRNLRSSTLPSTAEPSESKVGTPDDEPVGSDVNTDVGVGSEENSSSFRPTESNATLSDLSFQSRAESWETLSNYQKEDSIKDAPSLPTTSFDSSSETSKRNQRSRTLSKAVMEAQKETSFLMKPKSYQSKHGIGGEGVKTSDEQIADFADREPHTRMLSPTGGTEHLQPLRNHRKKSKKKPKESEAPRLYRLRSAKSMQNEALRNVLAVRESKRHIDELPSPMEEPAVSKHYEVKKTQTDASLSKDTEARPSPEKSQENHKVNSQEEADTSKAADLKMKETTSDSSAKFQPSAETIEIFHSGTQNDSKSSESISKKAKDSTGKEETGREEPELPVEQPKTPQQTSLRSGAPEPQDEVSSFIFGTGNTTARLGESCEFPFGLNWHFSDEDGSDNGGQIF